MMLPKLEYIKLTRQRLGITQRKLASLCGVSASLINQIETGRCKPSYETARKIFEILTSLNDQTSLKAGDICTREIVSVNQNDTVITAANKMMEKGFSQLPVMDGNKIVGLITDGRIMKEFVNKDSKTVARLTVKELMEPTPPIVDESTPVRALIPLIEFSKAVLVAKQGNVIGIITTADILKLML
ncbi:MAG: CBS domain-containing protein [Nitrososphaerota archaeon]|nr:CBS domain-containing protein [Nitrososphaerales archaeon]MCX8191482.1 CBS domain-containing protein [Nitrososphaerales archaeon]MDW8044329.1 CBS domain-containing protein [Nitrososphaerota archaeon]